MEMKLHLTHLFLNGVKEREIDMMTLKMLLRGRQPSNAQYPESVATFMKW
jgi:hypothetical protein